MHGGENREADGDLNTESSTSATVNKGFGEIAENGTVEWSTLAEKTTVGACNAIATVQLQSNELQSESWQRVEALVDDE